MSDIFTTDKRRKIMQSVSRFNTGPEKRVAALLRELNCRYRMNVASLPGKPDFYIKSLKVVIFVHGCFWHGHGKCRKGTTWSRTSNSYWHEKIVRNQRRDRKAVRILRQLGLKVFTLWECQIAKNGIPPRLKKTLQNKEIN